MHRDVRRLHRSAEQREDGSGSGGEVRSLDGFPGVLPHEVTPCEVPAGEVPAGEVVPQLPQRGPLNPSGRLNLEHELGGRQTVVEDIAKRRGRLPARSRRTKAFETFHETGGEIGTTGRQQRPPQGYVVAAGRGGFIEPVPRLGANRGVLTQQKSPAHRAVVMQGDADVRERPVGQFVTDRLAPGGGRLLEGSPIFASIDRAGIEPAEPAVCERRVGVAGDRDERLQWNRREVVAAFEKRRDEGPGVGVQRGEVSEPGRRIDRVERDEAPVPFNPRRRLRRRGPGQLGEQRENVIGREAVAGVDVVSREQSTGPAAKRRRPSGRQQLNQVRRGDWGGPVRLERRGGIEVATRGAAPHPAGRELQRLALPEADVRECPAIEEATGRLQFLVFNPLQYWRQRSQRALGVACGEPAKPPPHTPAEVVARVLGEQPRRAGRVVLGPRSPGQGEEPPPGVFPRVGAENGTIQREQHVGQRLGTVGRLEGFDQPFDERTMAGTIERLSEVPLHVTLGDRGQFAVGRFAVGRVAVGQFAVGWFTIFERGGPHGCQVGQSSGVRLLAKPRDEPVVVGCEEFIRRKIAGCRGIRWRGEIPGHRAGQFTGGLDGGWPVVPRAGGRLTRRSLTRRSTHSTINSLDAHSLDDEQPSENDISVGGVELAADALKVAVDVGQLGRRGVPLCQQVGDRPATLHELRVIGLQSLHSMGEQVTGREALTERVEGEGSGRLGREVAGRERIGRERIGRERIGRKVPGELRLGLRLAVASVDAIGRCPEGRRFAGEPVVAGSRPLGGDRIGRSRPLAKLPAGVGCGAAGRGGEARESRRAMRGDVVDAATLGDELAERGFARFQADEAFLVPALGQRTVSLVGGRVEAGEPAIQLVQSLGGVFGAANPLQVMAVQGRSIGEGRRQVRGRHESSQRAIVRLRHRQQNVRATGLRRRFPRRRHGWRRGRRGERREEVTRQSGGPLGLLSVDRRFGSLQANGRDRLGARHIRRQRLAVVTGDRRLAGEIVSLAIVGQRLVVQNRGERRHGGDITCGRARSTRRTRDARSTGGVGRRLDEGDANGRQGDRVVSGLANRGQGGRNAQREAQQSE